MWYDCWEGDINSDYVIIQTETEWIVQSIFTFDYIFKI